MELVVEPQVYRPRRVRSLVSIGCAAPFVVFGLASLCWGGVKAGWPGFYQLAIGATLLVGGAAMLRTRVRLDEQGLAKTPWLIPGFAFRWDAVESWYVAPVRRGERDGDSFTLQVARFRIRGRRQEVTVADSEAWRPGFDQFMRHVRQHVGDREQDQPAADP
jgi:hypothetical protein